MKKETHKIKINYSKVTRPNDIEQHIHEIGRGTKVAKNKYSRKEKYKHDYINDDYMEDGE